MTDADSLGCATDPGTHDELRARFARAVAAAGGTGSTDGAFEALAARWSEPHRRYHTLEHLGSCLTWLDWFSGSAQRPEEVALALFFHDAVYTIGSASNERDSAELARRELASLGVRPEAVARIATYVEATAHLSPDATQDLHGDAALVVDLDLSILGAAPAAYATFEQQIRDEYTAIPAEDFARGRARVLEAFLAQSPIYRTRAVREQLEPQARANLGRRLAELA